MRKRNEQAPWSTPVYVLGMSSSVVVTMSFHLPFKSILTVCRPCVVHRGLSPCPRALLARELAISVRSAARRLPDFEIEASSLCQRRLMIRPSQALSQECVYEIRSLEATVQYLYFSLTYPAVEYCRRPIIATSSKFIDRFTIAPTTNFQTLYSLSIVFPFLVTQNNSMGADSRLAANLRMSINIRCI